MGTPHHVHWCLPNDTCGNVPCHNTNWRIFVTIEVKRQLSPVASKLLSMAPLWNKMIPLQNDVSSWAKAFGCIQCSIGMGISLSTCCVSFASLFSCVLEFSFLLKMQILSEKQIPPWSVPNNHLHGQCNPGKPEACGGKGEMDLPYQELLNHTS